MTQLLMIDDDEKLVSLMREYLAPEGFVLTAAHDGPTGLASLSTVAPALVILDLMLPGLDGLEVCRRIRAESSVPILMLTARGDETDRIVGLELGADDYVPKPFNPRELLARIRAILRRLPARTEGPVPGAAPGAEPGATSVSVFGAGSESSRGPIAVEASRQAPSGHPGAARAGGVVVAGDIVLDPRARRLAVRGRDVELTTAEFDLLAAMMRSAGHALTRDQLLEAVHGPGWAAYDRSVDVHVSRIRQKIEVDPSRPAILKTIRGVGYQLCLTEIA